MPVTINASTSSGLVQSADTSGQIELQTNGTTVATVNTSNNVQFRSSISVGNATPSTSGAGITFPATQSASTDANTLDDYEEGTWTPTLSFGGGTTGITYSARAGSYIKIGSLVHVWVYLQLTNKGSSTGAAYIDNFPFTPLGTAAYYSSPTVNFGNITYTGQFAPYMDIGGQLYIQQTTEAGTQSNLTNTNFTNTSFVFLSWFYRASA